MIHRVVHALPATGRTPSDGGQRKVAALMLRFFKTAPTAKYRSPQIGTGIPCGLSRGYDLISSASTDRTAGRSP